MDRNKIIYLYLRCRDQTATAAEQDAFRLLLSDPETAHILEDFWDTYWPEDDFDQDALKVANYEQVFEQISAKPLHKIQRRSHWPQIAAAGLLLAAAGWFYTQSNLKKTIATVPTLAAAHIVPGSNKAYLTLADGKKITLTDAANGTLASQPGVQITKAAGGQLVYTTLQRKPEPAPRDILNTIETPKGGQYKLNLPDGSRVWLNAASKLIYPVSFAAKRERVVELSGEAYFEVTKDKFHPFKVKTGGQVIKVLGTHFNINSYPEEYATKTTLLEGAVQVFPRSGELTSLVLKPGQQAVLTPEAMHVKTIEVNDVIDWKNGEFIFDAEPLPAIMRKVARWYNVEVEYRNPHSKLNTFTGSVSKSDQIGSILKMLEKTSKLRFTIDGSKIIVD